MFCTLSPLCGACASSYAKCISSTTPPPTVACVRKWNLGFATHHIAKMRLPIHSELSRVSSIPPLPGKYRCHITNRHTTYVWYTLENLKQARKAPRDICDDLMGRACLGCGIAHSNCHRVSQGLGVEYYYRALGYGGNVNGGGISNWNRMSYSNPPRTGARTKHTHTQQLLQYSCFGYEGSTEDSTSTSCREFN